MVPGAAPAHAADSSFNPFEVNRGFTVVAQGNASLGNGEIEGSIAAFGSLASTVQNYPIRHHGSGLRDYQVPSIDGDPVRILARTFTGTGGIDLTNAGATANTPESRAIAKFVDTRGLRLDPLTPAYTRLLNAESTHDQEGNLNLKALPHASNVIKQRLQTELSSVGAYFDFDAQLPRINQCLSAMYDAEPAVVNHVNVEHQGNLAIVRSFATDRPNVFPYADLQGMTIKREGTAARYVPSAQAPIVIKVPAGTKSLGQINFEGWSAQDSAQQSYARHILLDLAAVTGDVKIDGLELGAIWAPRANLLFSSGVNTNGQWFAKNITTAGGGELHHHAFRGALPCPRTGGFSLTKVVSGDGSDLVGGRTFDFEVSIDGQPQVVRLADGGSRSFDDLPVGTRVRVTERPVVVPDRAVFDGVRFTLDASSVGSVDFTIEADSQRAVTATNTFSLEPDPLLTLVKRVPDGDPADWTLTAAAGDGDPVVTGQGTATGPVTAGVRYTLTESGGPAEYVQDGEWQCTAIRDGGTPAAVVVSAGAVVVPRNSHVTCTVTNVAATLTVLKLVTGESDLEPSDWELTATPGAGVDGLREITVAGATTPADASTVVVRPEHNYAITEQPVETNRTASLQVAFERYVGPTPDAPDHAVRAHWELADPAAVSVDRGTREIYRFVNFVPTPLAIPALGGIGTSSLRMAGGAVMAAGLIAGVVFRRRGTRSVT